MDNNNDRSETLKAYFWVAVAVLALFINIRSCVSCDNSSENTTNSSTVEKKPEYSNCAKCGERHKSSDLYWCEINPKVYNYVCKKCYDRIHLQKGIKDARNRWVDENPNEARRRGIHKF